MSILESSVVGCEWICVCRACERNEALYTAFNLSRRFDVRMEILNTTEVSELTELQYACTVPEMGQG